VKGAHITGSAPVNQTVSLSLKVKTNQGREFTYTQKTISSGTYEFIVPYSTEGPIPPERGGTDFDTKPVGKYVITAGNISREVAVEERDVLDGGTVKTNI